jgi:hypothetical protein
MFATGYDLDSKTVTITALVNRVARWYIFKTKILICVNIGGPWNGKDWYIIWTFENI